MAQVFLYRKGSGINDQQLQNLRRHGFVPVGVEHLSDAKVIDIAIPVPCETLDAVGRSALETISDCGVDWVGQKFAKSLSAILAANPATNKGYEG